MPTVLSISVFFLEKVLAELSSTMALELCMQLNSFKVYLKTCVGEALQCYG